MRKNIATAAMTEASPSKICARVSDANDKNAKYDAYEKPSPTLQTAYIIHIASDYTSEKT